MKVLTIHGVPYLTNEKNQVFLYQTSKTDHLCIGQWDPLTQKLELDTEWQSKAADFVAKYRTELKRQTESAMKHAKEIQGVD